MAMISEPYRVPNHPRWLGNPSGMSAIAWGPVEGMPAPRLVEAEDGIVAADWGSIRLISVYFSPNGDMVSFERLLDNIGDLMDRDGGRPTIVAGDFNSKSALWGSRDTNARERVLVDWLASRNLVILNVGTASTCVRWQGKSIVDITVASPDAARAVSNWRVDEERFSFSDHKYVRFEISYWWIVGTACQHSPPRLGCEETRS